MINMTKLVLLTSAFFILATDSSKLFAKGTTSSGGGEYIGDGHNPWFIQNTATVRYCIIHDQNAFHLPAGSGSELLSQKVQNALAFWRREFKATMSPASFRPGPTYQVATQTFIEGPCDPETDIRFQFGALEEAQILQLGDPHKYLSAFVRTSYDQKNLRGKGYVYLSADAGPLAPIDPNIADKRWSFGTGGLIELALGHELGHVFGLGHEDRLGVSYHDKLMGEEYIQWMMHPFNAGYDSTAQLSYYHFFTYNDGGGTVLGPSNRRVRGTEKISKFFGIKDDVTFQYFDFSAAPILRVYGVRTADINDLDFKPIEIGSATMTLIPSVSDVILTQKLWVTQEQSLFPCKSVVCGIPGPAYMREEWKGIFTSADGTVHRQLRIQRSPEASYGVSRLDKFRVGGVSETGELYIDLYKELLTEPEH